MRFKFELLLLIIGLILFCSPGKALSVIDLNREAGKYPVGKFVQSYSDQTNRLSFQEVSSPAFSSQFQSSSSDIFFYGLSRATHWFRLLVADNDSTNQTWYLLIDHPELGRVEVYDAMLPGSKPLYTAGLLVPFSERPVKANPLAFPISIHDHKPHEFYLKITSDRTCIVPLYITTAPEFFKSESYSNVAYGIYIGIMVGLMLYNLFLFFGLRDKAYLYYVFSILSILLLAMGSAGKVFQLFFPTHPHFARFLIEFTSCTVSIFAALFAISFLNIRKYSRLLYQTLIGIICAAFICIILLFTIDIISVQMILYPLLSFEIIILLASGVVSWRNGNRYAGYYIIAWLGYLIGGAMTMGRDLAIFPFNPYTTHAVEVGSALEVILLSMALSRRYQQFRREKDQAIREKLKVQQEANETLELKVSERTSELEKALLNLKSTQVQLVQAEKMASLGQVTAGVAHEINNPINFISGSLHPLKQDIDSLLNAINKYEALLPEEKKSAAQVLKKELDLSVTVDEIHHLLKGIELGTQRTASIVKSLRSFAGLDEKDFKEIDIHEDLDVTLAFLQNQFEDRITIIKKYGSLPKVKCNSIEMNQVFLQILQNAMQAIKEKGEIVIRTWFEHDTVKISFKDNGSGIPKKVIDKIFDPFFTTKDIGKGKGLGLNIAYGIIKKHSGFIKVESEEGKGANFIITLPCVS